MGAFWIYSTCVLLGTILGMFIGAKFLGTQDVSYELAIEKLRAKKGGKIEVSDIEMEIQDLEEKRKRKRRLFKRREK